MLTQLPQRPCQIPDLAPRSLAAKLFVVFMKKLLKIFGHEEDWLAHLGQLVAVLEKWVRAGSNCFIGHK